jgi:hypothetical protein
VGGSRRIEGVSRTQAFMRNCRNQAIDAKGEVQGQKTTRATVPMRWAGADRSVLVMKAL